MRCGEWSTPIGRSTRATKVMPLHPELMSPGARWRLALRRRPPPARIAPGARWRLALRRCPPPARIAPGARYRLALRRCPPPARIAPGARFRLALRRRPPPARIAPGARCRLASLRLPPPGLVSPKARFRLPLLPRPLPHDRRAAATFVLAWSRGALVPWWAVPAPPACRSARSRASSRPRFQEGARSQAPRIPQPVDFRAGRRQRTRGACRSRLLYVAKQRDGLRVLQNSVQAALGAPSKLGAFCRAALRPGPPVDHSINRDASMETPVPACPLAQGGPGPGLSSLLPCPPPPLPAERPLPTRGTAACRRRLQVQRVIGRWLSVAVCTLNYEHLGRPSSFEKHRQVCSAGKSATPAQAKALRALKGRIARHVRLVSRQTLSAASGRSAGPILNSLVEVASQSYERDVGRAAADTRLEAGFAGTNRSGRVTLTHPLPEGSSTLGPRLVRPQNARAPPPGANEPGTRQPTSAPDRGGRRGVLSHSNRGRDQPWGCPPPVRARSRGPPVLVASRLAVPKATAGQFRPSRYARCCF